MVKENVVMFFNVDEVREYLLEHGEVYTLRKKRFRLGKDVAVKGSYFKRETLAKIFIEKAVDEPIVYWRQLLPYVTRSGLMKPIPIGREFDLPTRERMKEAEAKKWFELAKKLSGPDLYLYHVSVRDKILLQASD